MLSYVEGQIKYIVGNKVLVYTTSGVGYEVVVSSTISVTMKEGQHIAFLLKTYFREDHFELYGFQSKDELMLFELLVTVSGVGPKMALGVLERHTVDEVKTAILSEDTSAFTMVSGIGKKNASRIILELKPKLSSEDADLGGLTQNKKDLELESALRQLGYRTQEISEMVRNVPQGLTLDEKIKHALKV